MKPTAFEHNQHDKMATLISSDMYENVTFDDDNAKCNDSKICSGDGITCSASHKYDTCIRTVIHIDCSKLSQLEYITFIHDEYHRTRGDYGDFCTNTSAELEYVYGKMAVDMLCRMQGTISIDEVDSTVGAEIEIADAINTKLDTTVYSENELEVFPNEFCYQLATQQFQSGVEIYPEMHLTINFQ
jgi:hypothetical protein